VIGYLFAGQVAIDYHSASKQARQKLRIWEPYRVPYGRQARDQKPPCSNTIQEKSEVIDTAASYKFRLRGPADLRDYISACQSGHFYESLNQDGVDRGEFKRRVFADLFFGEDRHPSKLREVFAQRFSTVARVLADLKSADYRRLAWLMQHEESKLFIGRICRRLMRERPSMPLCTIHDSLVSTEEHFDFVRQVSIDEFASQGIVPKFTVDLWDGHSI
jgi:hypothetical protein